MRNRAGIEAAGPTRARFAYIDTEYVAARMFRLARWLRGGDEVAWSTNMMMAYLPYVEFERQVLRRFCEPLRAGAFDVVHRITPMSPTLPSYMAGRTRQPFVLGPLNGNLAWPAAYAEEQARERGGLRRLRGLAKHLPLSRRTYRNSACILAAFQHTIDDLRAADPTKIVPMPEIGFDDALFHPDEARLPYDGIRPCQFLFVGALGTLQGARGGGSGPSPPRTRLPGIVFASSATDRSARAWRRSRRSMAPATASASRVAGPRPRSPKPCAKATASCSPRSESSAPAW